MQVTQYTEAIPVDQLKVGDILLSNSPRDSLTYICSIREFPSGYLRFNVKRLGYSRKVLDFFNSYSINNEHLVEFDRCNVTVIRLDSREDLEKFGASWKNIEQCFDHAVSLYDVCTATYKTPVYYGAAYILQMLDNDAKLLRVLEDKVTYAIRESVKKKPLMEELCLESVDQYNEFTLAHARDVAKLVLNGESVLDIRNRVAAWKLAYTEKEKADVRVQQAFNPAK